MFHLKYVRKRRKAKRTTAHGATLMSNISTNTSAMAQEADERERTQVTTTRKVRNLCKTCPFVPLLFQKSVTISSRLPKLYRKTERLVKYKATEGEQK